MSKWSKEGRQVGGEYSGLAKRPLASWVRAIVLAGVAGPAMSGAVLAQDIAEEEVVVTGTRQIIQDQIAIKRDNIGVVDGLSASDIGDLPALSIGEALESITGAASHRENGGATEISIRGLGPFLSATNFNGREATNGSGDRSVNFSQFPSELMSKLAIHKTQDASMIEGGVAGVISLETLKPLDYGKRRFQIDGKFSINPDELNVDNRFQGDIGTRITTSYVDQVEFNDMALGWSLGYQNSAMSQPEAEARSSSPTGSSLWACLNDPSVTNEGMFRDASGDCEDQNGGSKNQGYQTAIQSDGTAESGDTDYVWTGSSRGFRQNETSDEREAFFAAVQFQPSEQWDINLDVEMSERVQAEDRHDINIDQKRVTYSDGVNLTGLYVNDALRDADGNVIYDADGNFTAGPNAPKNHVIQQWYGDPNIIVGGEYFSRTEIYHGGGLAVTFTPTDALTLDLDIAHSRTTREELQLTLHMRSGGDGNLTRPTVSWVRDNEIPVFTVEDFDVTDPYSFASTSSSSNRVRADRENVRENVIDSIRFDAAYELDMPVISSVKGGVRTSKLTYMQWGGSQGNGSRTQLTLDTDEMSIDSLIDDCAIVFPESDFFTQIPDGPLFTQVDSATGNVVKTSNSYAAFDNKCLAKDIFASQGQSFEYPALEEVNSGTIDVTEETIGSYVMANFELDSGVRGNFGVRIVQTDITSVGYRSTYTVTRSDDGTVSLSEDGDNLERVEGGGNYTEVLPSAMFVYDLNDDMILRGGLFRGLSRVDPGDMGYSRTFQTSSDDDATSLSDLISSVNGSGNPNAKPYASWNTDLSWEWYPNDDAILAIGLYHKRFTGGSEQTTVNETFTIDGETVVLPITNTVTTDEESTLYGIEVTGSYRWDSGIGVKVSYNHANTDFEYEDSLYGTTYQDGEQLTVGIVPPASIAGFSEDSFSGQVYYQIGEFDVAAIYKYRSEYFQPYTSNGTRLRYVDAASVWEARASYKLTDNIKVKVEAINIFSEPKSQYFYQDDNPGEFNDYGPRLFLGVSAKF